MKKIISVLLIVSLLFITGCAPKDTNTDEKPSTMKVGMVCIGDDNAAYDRNFYMAADNATKILKDKGINVEWIYTYNHPEGDDVTNDCNDLADQGCKVVILNSYGQEPAMLQAAADHPEVIYASLTNEESSHDDLENTVNAFPSIYEGRYLAGIAAGCKLNEMIEEGKLDRYDALLGYVGAFPFAEVISGYSAFYLGAISVCPDARMKVTFVNSWSDPNMEQAAAETLYEEGCVIISQHSDSTTPATCAQSHGIYHIGYNIDMTDVAPDASIISTRIDWTNYFVYLLETVYNNEKPVQDYKGYGLESGDIVMTPINFEIAAADTNTKIDNAIEAIKRGDIKVFDTSTFTINDMPLTKSLVDITGDYIGEEDCNAVFDGYYHESYFKSAPAFAEPIDGIEIISE